MLDRLGFERRDQRNLLVVMALVTLVMMILSDGTLVVRLLVGVISGLISGVVFVVSTLLINQFKPDHW